MHRSPIGRWRTLAVITAVGLLASFLAAPTAQAGSTSKQSAARNATAAQTSGGGGAARAGTYANGVKVGQSVKNDVSPKLSSVNAQAPKAQSNKQVVPVLPLPNKHKAANRKDTAIQTNAPTRKMPDPGLNFEGIDFPGVICNCAPPDTNGEVGDTQYVQIVNEGLQVFDKTNGNSELGPISIESLWNGFGGVCQSNGEGDPVVLYDQLAARWVVTQFAGTAQPTHECVAVSTSDDATGTYNRYDFDLGTAFGNNFYDYPKLGVWPDAYYMSINVFNASGTAFLGPQPFAMDRNAMLAGQQASIVSTGPLGSSDDQLMPADMDGSIQPPAGAPNPFTEIGTSPTWKVWRFHVDFVSPSNSTFTQAGTLTPDPFTVVCGNGGACVPQLGVSDVLDTLGDRSMFRNAYRRFPDGHEALVGNMTVAGTNGVAGIRWYEINNATSGTPSFVQQSTYQPDSTYRWMGSAAMDAQGDLAVGFSASSSTINPQLRYAGRLAGDPPNTLAQGEATLFAGTGSQIDTVNRWGDYSDLTVDPTDDCTFWYTSEYYQTNSSFNWRTRIGNFKFPNCTAGPSGTLSGTVTNASNNNPISGVDVSTSFGDTTTDDNGNYSITLPVGTYDVTYSRFGFATDTETGVNITDGNTTTVNVALQPAAAVTVSGTITDGSGHGWPLYTRIDVAGDPDSPFFTDPITGQYSISLPGGASYGVTFTSQIPGYQAVNQTLDVGGSNLTHDVQVPVTPDCSAPGYKQDIALSEGFEQSTFPPQGWNVVDNIGQGHVWQQNDPEGQQNQTGGSGNFADINSDFYGSGNTQDTSLVTPTFDLSGTTSPTLTFHNHYFASPSFPQTGDVDVTTDGGATWTNVWHHAGDSVPGPSLQTVDLSQFAGQSSVKVRYHFTSTFGFWWQVDDVTVLKSANCVKIPGGLVEGTVLDKSSGNPINGATIQSDDAPADKGKSAATPADPNNPDGYYWLFSSLTGSHSFTASAPLHSNDSETANVAADGTVRRDFSLGVGHLTIAPASISTTQVLGTTKTQVLSFSNDGTGPVHVKLSERGGTGTILSAVGAKLDNIHLGEDNQPSPAWLGANQTDNMPRENAGGPKDPSWSTIAPYPTSIMDNGADIIDGQEYSVGGVDGTLSLLNKGWVYNHDNNAWTPIANMSTAREKPGVAAVNGKLYVTGGWDSSGNPSPVTEVYDPNTNAWTTLAPNPSPSAAPGVAVVNDNIYFVGGCADGSCTPSSKVEVYNTDTDSWSSAANYPSGDSWQGCGGINGEVYCAGGINGSASLTTAYVYDPSADAWSPIANIPTDLWGGVSGAPNGLLVISGGVINNGSTITNEGFAYDPSSDSWSAIPNAQFPRYRAGGGCGYYKVGGSSGGFSPTPDSEFLSDLDQCGTSDIPWLGEDPGEFDVAVGQTVNVTVTLGATTANGVQQPGTYTGQIAVNANSPQTINPIDVTMNVTPPKGWGKLTGTLSGTDCNGKNGPIKGVVFADSKNFSWTAKSGSDGKYGFWGPQGSYTLIASANGWIPQTKTASIKQGKTVTVNFTLRPTSC